MNNNLIKYIYHCSYLANKFYIMYKAMQTVSAYSVFYYIRGVIYITWKVRESSKTFWGQVAGLGSNTFLHLNTEIVCICTENHKKACICNLVCI